MNWIKFFIAILIPTVSGFIILTSIYREKVKATFYERLFLGFGAGMGVLSFTILIGGLIGILFTFPTIALIQVAVLVPFLIYPRLGRFNPHSAQESQPQQPKPEYDYLKTAVAVLLVVWIAGKIFFVFYSGFTNPIGSYDAWMNYGSGAKLFFYEGGLILDKENEHFFGTGYRVFMGHPFLTTFLQVWISNVLGDYNEVLAKAYMPFFFLALLGLFYTAVRKELGGFYTLAATFFLSTLPLLTYHAQDGYSDLPLSFYVLAGGVSLWTYMEWGVCSHLVISGFSMSMAALTKNEGLLYLISGGAALLAYLIFERKFTWRSIAYYAVPALIFVLPWLVFKAYFGLGFGHSHGTSGIDWEASFHFEVFPIILRELFLSANHGLVFPVLAMVTVIGLRTVLSGNIKYIYLIILLISGALLILYTMTRDFTAVTHGTGLNRNLLAFAPLAFFVSILICSRVIDLRVSKP